MLCLLRLWGTKDSISIVVVEQLIYDAFLQIQNLAPIVQKQNKMPLLKLSNLESLQFCYITLWYEMSIILLMESSRYFYLPCPANMAQ